jgi:carboxyl-terminal processing protease
LGKAFHTANGRVVYEGHGIQPDVKIEPTMASTITMNLYSKNLFFKYANKYYREHKSIKSAKDFQISDAEYEDFMQYVKDEGFTFTSQSEKEIKELERIAKLEGYLEDIQPMLDEAKAKIEVEKTKDLIDNRSEIEEMLEAEIVSRYYYQKGRIIATLDDDPELARAFEVILNQEEYNNILKGTK